MVNAVCRVQSAVKTPAEGPKNVIIFVLGHLNPRVSGLPLDPSHSVVMVVLGVLNAIVVSGGHEKVIGLTIAGKVIVMTVAAVAVMVV